MVIERKRFHQFPLFNFLQRGKERKILGIVLFSLLWGTEINAQVKVYTEQNVVFGSFVVGNGGGTVTISHDGVRSATGDILLMNTNEQFHPAIFEVEAPPGMRIFIQNGPDVQMTGRNGEKMTLSLGESSHGSSFVSNLLEGLSGIPNKILVSVSATLSAGNSTVTPPGDYNGTISVTFIKDRPTRGGI